MGKMCISQEEYEWFKLWLESKGKEFELLSGPYELLRWKGEPGKPMPIAYRRDKSDMITLNVSAAAIYRKYLRGAKQS